MDAITYTTRAVRGFCVCKKGGDVVFYVYLIRNKYNGKTYVGSTNNFKRRILNHFGRLRSGTHSNRRLSKDYERYGGESAFESHILATAQTQDKVYAFEEIFMRGFNASYNILPHAGTPKGRKHILTTLQKMSETAKKRVVTDEQKARLSGLQIGRKQPEAEKAKRAKTLKEYYLNNPCKNVKVSDELAYLIIKLVDLGFDRGLVSEKYNIPITTVCSIARGSTRKRIYKQYHQDKQSESA